MTLLFRAPAVVVSGPGQPVQVRLPPKSRIVFLCRAQRPEVPPITEPGHYAIDIEANRPTDWPWPIIIVIVRAKHLRAFEKLSQSEIDKIVDQSQHRPSIH